MTLLEVVIALSLVALIVGIGVIKYEDGSEERTIRQGASRIEAMASRAHAMSILHQKPFWLRFEEGRVVLAGADIKTPAPEEDQRPDFKWDRLEGPVSQEVIYDEYATEAVVSLHRWGTKSDEWLEPNEDQALTWLFQSTGLCEPVGIRLEVEDSWVIMQMHPLTARVEEEEMMIR
jgi:hypothetical protein